MRPAMPWLTAAVPRLAWPDALARVADAASLVCLHGAGGDTVLAIAAETRSLTSWDDVAALREAAPTSSAAPTTPGWHPRGPGWAVQLDYEFPRSPGMAWHLDAYAHWTADGELTLQASERAGLDRLQSLLAGPLPACPAPVLATPLMPAWNATAHAERVERIRAWIAAGDIYQANLTLPISARLTPSPSPEAGLFLAMTRQSPAPYAALLRAPPESVTVQ